MYGQDLICAVDVFSHFPSEPRDSLSMMYILISSNISVYEKYVFEH